MDAPGRVVSYAKSDAAVSPANSPAEARHSALPASVDTLGRAQVTPGAATHGGPVQASADAIVGGAVPASLGTRGSGPVPAGGAPSGAGHAPAQSIREAVEQLLEAQEADEAVAEWMQGGG